MQALLIVVLHDQSVESLTELRDRIRELLLADKMVNREMLRVGLETITLYAVDIQISCYLNTNDFDEFISEKHRLLIQILSLLDLGGIKRAVIRKD